MGKTEYHQRIGRKIEALVICVNYGDFLKITLPKNKKQIEDITVITSFNDKETIDICNQNDIDYILTDDFFRDGFSFVKSAGYAVAFNFLHYKDWILLIDADVILNENFGSYIKENIIKLNKKCLYGCTGFLVEKYSDFLLLKNNKKIIRDFDSFSEECIGNGYFQLFNFSKFNDYELWKIYPQTGTGIDEDTLFRLKFGKNCIKDGKWIMDKNFNKTIDLPLLHLGKLSVNHGSRKSERFE